MVVMLLIGAANTIVSKVIAGMTALGDVYYHPLVLTEFIYLGYLSCFLVYLFSKEDDSNPKPLMPLWMALIPGSFDFL